MKISKLDQKIIGLVSRDFSLVKEPFKEIAAKLQIKEKILLERLNYYKKSKIIRKFSGVLNHINAGFKYNSMVVWNIPDALIEKAANIMGSYDAITHCYQRKQTPEWNYNLYSMIHGRTKKYCLDIVKDISRKIGCYDYKVLFSSKEYKKTAVQL